MIKKRKEQPLDAWLREAAAAMIKLADDIDREIYDEEPQAEAYDIECGCREILDYIGYYRTECEAREAAMAEDDTTSLRLGAHQVI